MPRLRTKLADIEAILLADIAKEASRSALSLCTALRVLRDGRIDGVASFAPETSGEPETPRERVKLGRDPGLSRPGVTGGRRPGRPVLRVGRDGGPWGNSSSALSLEGGKRG